MYYRYHCLQNPASKGPKVIDSEYLPTNIACKIRVNSYPGPGAGPIFFFVFKYVYTHPIAVIATVSSNTDTTGMNLFDNSYFVSIQKSHRVGVQLFS